MTTSWLRSPGALVGVNAGAVALAIALIQLRDGVVPAFDTVTYWSGADSVASGDLLSARFAPAFSSTDVIEFLERDGRAWFTDFAVGYPMLAGLLGALVGVKTAMAVLCIASAAAIGLLAVLGPGDRASIPTSVARGVVGVALVALPIQRLVTRAALSEPLFCALAVGCVVAVLRARRADRLCWGGVALAAAAGAVRFVGAALVVLPAVDAWRRRRWRDGALMAALGIAPAALNAVWAGLAGGGHRGGWRGLAGEDAQFLARSVAGWLHSGNGDIGRSLFGADRTPDAWVWVVLAAWIGLVVVGMVAFVLDRPWLPEPLRVSLAAAGVLGLALLAGMLAFDSLVVPDNRLMLPAGVLTLLGAVWSVDVRGRAGVAAGAVVVLWIVVAVDVFGIADGGPEPDDDEPAHMALVDELGDGPVVSNDADRIHWATGVPAVYPPYRTEPLTGERRDVSSIYDRLPCALEESGGVVVLVDDPFFETDARAPLDALVADGRLTVVPDEGARVYRTSGSACEAG